MGRALFVGGVGTEVGKTYVSALIVKKLRALGRRVGYFKPAASGGDRDATGALYSIDARFVRDFSGLDEEMTACPFSYERAVSPHLAAQIEGRPFEEEVARRAFDASLAACDYLVVEGCGGLYCPLRWDANARILLYELVKRWSLPCLLVADSGLGTINATSLSAALLHREEIPLVGLVFNRFDASDAMRVDGARVASELSRAPIFARVGEGDVELDVDPDALAALFR